MLYSFKKYLSTLDETVVGTSVMGATIGAVCGVSRLYDTCSGYADACHDSIPVINPSVSEVTSVAAASAVTGALAFYSLGLLTTHVIAPAGESFLGWMCGNKKKVEIEPQVESKIEPLDKKILSI